MTIKKRFYPSQRNKKTSWQEFNQDNTKFLNLNKPYYFENKECDNLFTSWQTSFFDSWKNEIASVNSNNSILQYSNFELEKIPYNECATLSTDSIINNAISKLTDDLFSRGGFFTIESKDEGFNSDYYLMLLDKEFKRLNLWESLREAIETNLIFGGALIFFDFNTENLQDEIFYKVEILQKNKFQGLRIIPPYLCAPYNVDTANPLNKDFMRPKKWYISGSGSVVDSTRTYNLSFFESPHLLKPLYNFFGIPYVQFMKPYVMSADIARQSLADLFLRFRSEAIKTDLVKINMTEAKERAKAINKMKNNLGVMLLTPDEEYIQTITPITGLDKLIAQMQENIAVSARMPAVKLLGLTPSGFNATGDFDLYSYYDLISSLQNTKIKPIIDKLADIILKSKGCECYVEYTFNILEKESTLEKAQVENLNADFVSKNIASGIITQEQGMQFLKEKDLLNKSLEYENDSDLSDFDNFQENL